MVSTSRPLELLHIDLFGPMDVLSMDGKSYGFVIVDDYSRFTWVYFLSHKDEALHTFIRHCKKVQNEKDLTLISVRSGHGDEFENHSFEMCHNGFPPRLGRLPKIKWSRHRSFLYGCNRSPGTHVLKLGIEIPNLK